MKDITHDLTQFERAQLFYHCDRGVLKDGKSEVLRYVRKFRSEKMEHNGNTYYRTGEVEEDEKGTYHLVYKLKD